MNMELSQKVALKVKQISAEKQVSINKLAKMCNMTQSTFQSLIDGKSKNPKLLTINKICEGVGISLADFFSDEIFKK